MHKKYITFECPLNYSLESTCHIHGWKNLAPFIWDPSKKSLRFAHFTDNYAVDVEAVQNGTKIKILINSHNNLIAKNIEILKKSIIRSLSLDVDTKELLKKSSAIGFEYEKLILGGAGRLLRAPTLWEDAAKTLFTTNCSWALTSKMCSGACSNKFSIPTPGGRFPFPKPEVFSDLEPNDLKRLIPIGYRAKFLIKLANRFVSNPILNGIENKNLDYNSAFNIVNKLKGFGPYASTHLMILAGYYDKIPIDTVVLSYLKKHYRFRKPESFIQRHYKKWGEYKWWGLKFEKIIRKENWLGD